ncbi:metalloregulator ArsR/SmtB family transcription factor [Propionivibrio sp.]|uniref:ArsR/SmtB family transcription factor n=1 Tax=Propionivibrio sp. TaxID=2212460 RepID=UPI00260E3C3C|nr:metalloregulator ArsR/SmtB family transcription factor [Propionivibrio sp.]
MSKSYYRALPRIWAERSGVFTALGDEHRQRILLMFERNEELTVKDIVDASPLSRTAVTHHVRVLLEAGVLRAEKRGRSVFLRPCPKRVLEAMDAVHDYISKEL